MIRSIVGWAGDITFTSNAAQWACVQAIDKALYPEEFLEDGETEGSAIDAAVAAWEGLSDDEQAQLAANEPGTHELGLTFDDLYELSSPELPLFFI